MIRYLLIIIVYLGFCLNLSATTEYSKKNEIIIVGENNFPPYSYTDNNGQPEGFTVELVKEIMQRLNCKYKIKLINWKSAIDNLATKKADLLINIAYNEHRDSIFEFSTAYSYAKFNLITLNSSHLKYKSDLKDKQIILQKNSISETLLKESDCGCKYIYGDSVLDVLNKLSAGKGDACVVNSVVAEYYIEKLHFNNITVNQLSFGTLENCFATYKENNAIIRDINKVLLKMNSDGTYNKLYSKWLSPEPITFWGKYGFPTSIVCLLVALSLLFCLLYYLHALKSTSKTLKNSNTDLLTSNSLLCQIIKQIPMGVFIKDADDDFRYVMVNDLLKSYYPCHQKDTIGKCDKDIFDTHHANTFHNQDTTILNAKGGNIRYKKSEILNGEKRIYSIHGTMCITPTGKKFILGLVNDITESEEIKIKLKQAKEKAEQSDKLKSAFLANMSHEIRTPLNAIIGFSELMSEDLTPQEKEEFINIIHINNELLLNLINDILDLSKIEAGMLKFNYENFELSSYFDELAKSFKKTLKKPDIKIIVSNPYKECNVYTDKKRYTQVLTNFVTNAIKYTDKGYIKIGYEYDGTNIRTYVEDTGIGIDKEKQSKLFGRFEKLDSFAQGTGLGLAISKAIVEQNKGKIGFKSEKGIGSEFWFTFNNIAITENSCN